MKSAILRAAVLATATIGLLGLAIPPVHAAMTASVASINQCDSGGSCGTAIKTDGTGMAHGTIQITAHEGSALLDPAPQWVRIQVRNDTSSAFTCLVQWSTTSKNFTASTKWNDTSSIPSQGAGCPSGGAGGATNNGTLQVQVLSHNGNGTSSSSIVTIKLNNAPTPPAWAANPSVSGAAKRAPVVTLKWNASPEPDIQEYRFFRTDPSGTTKQYPVSASNPSAQGCSFNGTTYTCYDTDFSSTGFGGTYSYAIAAWRSSPSPADTCYYPNQQTPCIGAQSSDVKQVTITEPAAPSPSPTGGSGGGGGGTSLGGGGGSGTGSVPSGVPSVSSRDPLQPQPRTNVLGQTVSPGDCFTCGTYKETLPYGQLPGSDGQTGSLPGGQQRPVLAAGSGLGSGSGGPDPRQLWVSMAAGLVLLLTAGHVARVLRATAH
jgi:hypothetical protein